MAENIIRVALAGNPNVGKSTVFNALTGSRQHTGNWSGKTVEGATGHFTHNGRDYILEDVPGTYSLAARSAEEEAARDILCFSPAEAVILVCDATCLSRSMTLALQLLERRKKVMICLNLADEAEKKGVRADIGLLEERLGIPVVATAARSGKGLDLLLDTLEQVVTGKRVCTPAAVDYGPELEQQISQLIGSLDLQRFDCPRWLALRILEGEASMLRALQERFDPNIPCTFDFSREIARQLNTRAKQLLQGVLGEVSSGYDRRNARLDRFFTGKVSGTAVMLLLLCLVFWITIKAANRPSEFLSGLLFCLEDKLALALLALGAPEFIVNMLIHGMCRVLFWVTSVMLPPMAIFFPLFTLLEDWGYLPRIAFNMDGCFRRCHACGKQCLTMCMGLGCNAVGVTGCRIIDSPRERLIAIITNSFMPCNGRFPLMISLLSIFAFGGVLPSLAAAAGLAGVMLLGIAMTLLVSRLLSATVLKGVPSNFMLELPPFRRPQIGKVIIRSLLDRTLFVLGRAVMVAAPAGLIIWLLANTHIDGTSLLLHAASALDGIGRFLGMDGVILMGFILGWPANEIVTPIIIMCYMASGSMTEFESLAQLRALLAANGWTWVTALCTILFSLMHWPCSTTCLTIYKETGSLKWTLASVLIPLACGCTCCALVNLIFG